MIADSTKKEDAKEMFKYVWYGIYKEPASYTVITTLRIILRGVELIYNEYDWKY
jgi:hypothetical protein